MKAHSRARKLKKRRGRPSKPGLREPNGRVSRAKVPRDPFPAQTALDARAKHNRLTADQAKDPRAATYIGRLNMLGRKDGLSDDQYQAAIIFLQIRNNYQKSLLSPGAYYESLGLPSDMFNTEDYADRCTQAKLRYEAAMGCVTEAQFDNKCENLYAALQYVIIDGLELPHLLGATRMVLNALHRHF